MPFCLRVSSQFPSAPDHAIRPLLTRDHPLCTDELKRRCENGLCLLLQKPCYNVLLVQTAHPSPETHCGLLQSQVRLELYLRKYWYFSHQKMMDFRFAYKVQRFLTRRFYARNKLRGALHRDISMSTGPI